MQEFPINWWAVIVAAVARFVLGAIWYSPPLFLRSWQAATGISDDAMKVRMPRALPLDAVGALVMSFILLHAVHYAGATTVLQGAAVGLLNWIGFMLFVSASQTVFEGKPRQVFLINAGYNAVALILMGAILAIWP